MEGESTYTPPEILDDMDEDVIHARMLAVIPDNIDTTDSGFAYDFTMPAAIEKAGAMIILNEIVQLFFPEWSSGEFLDKLGQAVGLTRKAATAAEATLTITGTAGITIPEGFIFSTPATAISENVEFEAAHEVTIGENGAASILVVCTETGTIGNVTAHSITLMAEPIDGITAITNEEAATGGTNDEEDEDFSARIVEKERNTDNSFVGCDADYKRWAQEVDGVGTALVVPEWDGPGTVKLIVMDSNSEPATETIIENVYNHIVSPDDPDARLAPIGATLTVVTSIVLSLTISAHVYIESDAIEEEVLEAFKTSLNTCLEAAKSEGILRHTRVGAVLSATPGVVDYDNLLINGSTDNIEIEIDEYPVATEVDLTMEVSTA